MLKKAKDPSLPSSSTLEENSDPLEEARDELEEDLDEVEDHVGTEVQEEAHKNTAENEEGFADVLNNVKSTAKRCS